MKLGIRFRYLLLILGLGVFGTSPTIAQEKPKPEFPKFDVITKGYKEVEPPTGTTPFMRLWRRDKDGNMLAQLPRDYASPMHRQFIAPTVAGGEIFAGLQSDALYVYWKRYGKRLALIAENLEIRGSDDESKSSVKRIFTDRVLCDLPILTLGPKGGPIIDLDGLLVQKANIFLGGGYSSFNNLISIKKAKVFKNNVEVAFEIPTSGGTLKTLHYSISRIKGDPGYKPRKADQRIGYFTTAYDDYGKYESDDIRIRFINRWHLEKRDPKLKMSPPKKPIVFYIEHTTPVRYRRWVRKGILSWNKAFEKVGIIDAIEVRQQDKQTNQHMDKDPEDVQYNFVRWLNNNVSTAIGPSRVNPRTGQILDADIVLTDGWIRVFEDQFTDLMPKVAMQGMTPETLAWLAKHPKWDPRVRMADPSQRQFIRQSILHQASQPFAGHAYASNKTKMLGDDPTDGLANRTSQVNGSCMAAEGRKFDVAMMRMMINLKRFEDEEKGKDKEGDKKEEKEDEDKEQMLDGMPESFIGPLLADLVGHEVGHTLGLRHNFKASSIYTLAEINSDEVKGKKPLAGSVMDYLPTNFNFEAGKVQGDYAMIGVGPYDLWAIEYGYTLDNAKLPKILSRVAEPELIFATDQDTLGPDPLARRYDFSKDPLDFANNQVRLANHHRKQLLEHFVKKGDSWEKARVGYLLTLRLQTSALSMMSNWIGGTHVYFDKKGDPNGRKPVEVVDVETQRNALKFVIENSLRDEAFGLTAELLAHMTSSGWRETFNFDEGAWPVHDRIMSVQSSVLTQLMNPTTLRRVYDNEFRVSPEEDALTLNELLTAVSTEVFSELKNLPKGKFTERKPAISSLRRNLQTEYLERLFDLADERNGAEATKPISNLATLKLRELQPQIEAASKESGLDAYTKAHLSDAAQRIQKWLDSLYVVREESGGGFPMFLFGKEQQEFGRQR